MKQLGKGKNASEVLIRLMDRVGLQKRNEDIAKGVSLDKGYLSLYPGNNVCWNYKGVIEKSSSLLVQWSVEKVIEVDIASHKLLKVNGEEVSGVEHKRVLDLNDDGERWEGDVLNNEPYGWGVLYDSEGKKVYEGFRVGDVNVCYGTRYYSDIAKMEYEGEWFEGTRWGRGIEFDRYGKVVFEGKWLNDLQLETRLEVRGEGMLHNHIEELIIPEGSCNEEEWEWLDLSCMANLRELRVGDHSLQCVTKVKLVGLERLERVEVGVECFTSHRHRTRFFRARGSFTLKDCEKLKELTIGCESFFYYTICTIENVPSLETLEMGQIGTDSFCFEYASLQLKGSHPTRVQH